MMTLVFIVRRWGGSILGATLTLLLGASAQPARADINQTTTLSSGSALNLDTGAVVSSGGDIRWDGTTITPQGAATAANISPTLGRLSQPESYFDAFKNNASSKPLLAIRMVVGDVFAVFTNGGHTAGVLITAVGGGSITLQFITFGATPLGPQVDSILNNSSLIPDGTPSSGIAPSSIFIVRGENLADPGDPVLQSSADPGLSTTLNGANITVVVNGVTVHPALYYTSPTQLAAVLPANTPMGDGTLTVTYRGASSQAATIHVVAHAPGINTYYTNSGVATDNATGALLTFTNSASPGETIVLWTTGLGADPADSDTVYSSNPHDIDAPVQVFIGGVAANLLYHGSAGYPGVNQIDLTIPDSAPTGCWVPIAVIAGGTISNVATLPINPGGGACLDQATGLNGNQIAPTGGTTIRGGLVAVGRTNTPSKSGREISSFADAAFEKYSGIYVPPFSLSPGGCLLTYNTPVPIPNITGLDVGSITLTGPGGLNTKMASQGIKGAFYSLLASTAVPDTGGTFTFTGTGGADVGAFTAMITFTNPLLTWTNTSVADNVDRSQDLTVKWTGGNPGSLVYILGTSGAGPGRAPVSFTCLAHTDDGQFTVPSYILSGLVPGAGAIQLQNSIMGPLPASGLDAAIAQGAVSYSESGTFK
ncbi:MAG TPA: hypothetical protein VMH05_22360 [Bryobacteraceae bacterium]|nr:hypothetical protein [Bryobacteraceae bacterium]